MIRPLQHLTVASKLYPEAWRLIDEFRQSRGKDLPKWPNWCFLPMAAFYAFVSSAAGVSHLPLNLIGNVARLAALGTWRVTQGIYRFDSVFRQALVDSPIMGTIPVEVLHRLPEWCVYVETPEYQFKGDVLHGFFAHLEWDVNAQRTELRFLMDTDTGLLSFVLHMGPWTVTEALDRAVKEGCKQAAGIGLNHEVEMDEIAVLSMEIRPLLSLLLYLCSEKPEYSCGVPGRPIPKKTKKGWRLFPPDKPKFIEVGKTIGESLRSDAFHRSTDGIEGKSKSPHVRGGHWHGYWLGPKNGVQRFSYRWLSTMTVNLKKSP